MLTRYWILFLKLLFLLNVEFRPSFFNHVINLSSAVLGMLLFYLRTKFLCELWKARKSSFSWTLLFSGLRYLGKLLLLLLLWLYNFINLLTFQRSFQFLNWLLLRQVVASIINLIRQIVILNLLRLGFLYNQLNIWVCSSLWRHILFFTITEFFKFRKACCNIILACLSFYCPDSISNSLYLIVKLPHFFKVS